MASFAYSGRNASGQLISGKADGNSVDAVASQLLSNGITPIKIDAVEEKSGSESRFKDLLRPKVETDDLIMFSRQMNSLTKAGVPINRAIKGLADSSRHPVLVETLSDIERTLSSGVNLSTAMSRHPKVFSPLYLNIIAVGESTGQLDSVFRQMASYLELDKETTRSIVSALRYPSFVLIAISIAVVVLNIWVIPAFVGVFEKFGSDLPLMTKILIGTSNFFVNYWYMLLIVVAGTVFAVRTYISTPAGRFEWDRRKIRLPVVGDILERAMLARYARSFALMLKAGLPMIQALVLCAEAVGNTYIEAKIKDMRQGIERGESLSRTSSESGMFTPLVLQMVAVGEESGQIDELLMEVAELQEVAYDVGNLSSLIEPIMTVIMAGIVLVLALGIFLPMWSLYSV